MTTTKTPPISTRSIDNLPCVIAPADRITPALSGSQQLTIETGPLAGDKVWLHGRQCNGPTHTFAFHNLAAKIQHPRLGEVLTAWIDIRAGRLDDAPALRAILGRHAREADAQDRAARVAVPSCDNCGDCSECC